MVSEKPPDYSIIIRRSLTDALDYRRNHSRRSDADRNQDLILEYETAVHMLDTRQLAIVLSSTAELIDDHGCLIIPAADATLVIEALFLAGALRISQGRIREAEPFRIMAAALGDSR
jgi:endo-alpha-1,4-polygalactosaminidase (GH114 family)